MSSGSGPPGNSTMFNGKSGIISMLQGPSRSQPDFELCQQLPVQAAEAAIAHDQHVIARAKLLPEPLEETLQRGRDVCALSQDAQRRRQIPAEISWRQKPAL